MLMYAALNVHSYYSLGWGIASPEKICQTAWNFSDCTALAMTDTESLYGLFFFLDFAKTFGIRPIVGAELASSDRRVTLLVRDRTGYANLCRLITARKMQSEFNLEGELLKHSEGLVILTDSSSLLQHLEHA